MKQLLCKVRCFLQEVGYARAAATLAQQGKHELARQLMTMRKDTSCKCC
jgi:hypothetical protein